MENQASNIKEDKPKSMLMQILTDHNTTIIAIVMSLISIQAGEIDDLKDKAEFIAQQADQAYDKAEDNVNDINNEEKELNIKYAGSSEALAKAEEEFQKEEDSLVTKASDAKKLEETSDELLATAKRKETESNWAKEISELGVLLSAIGVSSKNKLLPKIAILMTVICVILALLTFF